MIDLDPHSAVPPYEQVRTQVARQVAAGQLLPGTRLPTVRQLSADLGLAVNTVARAYRALEADGVIATQGRRGTFVRSAAVADTPAALEDAVRAYTTTARQLGLTCAEATRLVERAWST